MKRFALLLCILMLAVTGCSSKKVSEFDYNKALAERDDYKAKYTALLEEQNENAEKQRPLSYADAWVKASFGENALWALVGEQYLQVIVPTGAPVSADQAELSYSAYQASIKSLAGIYQVNTEHFTFSTISVSFLDENNQPLFSGLIQKGAAGFEAGAVTISPSNMTMIQEGIARASSTERE